MSLIATQLQSWRKENPNFDKNMARPLEYGALDFFVDQSKLPNGILTEEMKRTAMRSMGNKLEIPVLDYNGNVRVSHTRTCVIQDAENTSKLYTVVFATYAVGFTMVPSLYKNNEIGYQKDFNRKMNDVSRALATELDQAAIAALEANKTKVFKDKLIYTESGNALKVPWDMRDEIIGDEMPIMRANAYSGTLHNIGNTGLLSMLQKQQQHGEYNDVNKRLEAAGKVMHYTPNIENELGDYATFFAVADGNVSMLTRVDREAESGTKSGVHEWGKLFMPYIGFPVGYHYYTAVGDNSEIAGAASADMTCVVKEYFGMSTDVAFIVAYNSDPSTIANPIIKIIIERSKAANPVARPVTVVNGEDNPVFTKEVAMP